MISSSPQDTAYPASPRPGRRLDIQGLRAIAVLQVVAFHAGLPLPGGFVGVDVFFVISGFVITAMLEREWTSTGNIRLGRFYVRRFKRLTPALAVMAGVTVVLSAVLLSPIMRQQAAAKTAIAAMLLTANRTIAITTGGYFDAQAETNPLLHTWSLSVEEQFYLVFPLIISIAWVLARRTGFRNTGFVIVSTVTLLSFVMAIAGALSDQAGDSPWLIGFYGPLARAWEFGAGALLALAGLRFTIRSRLVANLLGALGLMGLSVSLLAITGSTPLLPVWTILPVGATLVLIASGTNASNAVSRLLGSSPLVRLGDWSYSIYLWHWPLIVFAGALWPAQRWAVFVAAALSFAPAIASYRWVERPIRDLPPLSRRQLASLVLATVIPPVSVAASIGIAARSGWWNPRIVAALEDITADHGPGSVCITTGPYTKDAVDKCEWNASGLADPVYLVGDSDAWQFVEAITAAGKMTGRAAKVFTSPSCPFILDLRIASARKSEFFPPGLPRTGDFDHCPGYVNFTLTWLKTARPGIVFIASLDQYWWDPGLRAALGDQVGDTAWDAKVALLRKGLTRTVEMLQTSGHKVVLVQSIPTFRNPAPIWDPSTCSAYTLMRGECNRKLSRQFVQDLQRPSRDALVGVANATRSTVLDLRESLCDAHHCSATNEDSWMYRDATHLSVSGSYKLAPRFVAAINLAARGPIAAAGGKAQSDVAARRD